MTVVDEQTPAGVLPEGKPRSEHAAMRLRTYDRRARIPIVLSALLPLILVPQQGHWVAIVVGVVSWLVFLIDFVVHERLLIRYLSTGYGRFDLAIVVLTAPWFLLPGVASGGGIVVVLRLARLVRLVVATRGARRLFDRLGKVAIVALAVVFIGAAVAYYAEHPVNPEFASYGDSLWWAIVTLTTVGYGDIVPETTTGRFAAVVIMVTGISVLGLLAGSLSSFFRLDPTPEENKAAEDERTATLEPVMDEITKLRAQVALLAERLDVGSGNGSGATPRE